MVVARQQGSNSCLHVSVFISYDIPSKKTEGVMWIRPGCTKVIIIIIIPFLLLPHLYNLTTAEKSIQDSLPFYCGRSK
jgi:hypothetical protein